MKQIKVIISGGGTGGHIFPAIAIADTIKKRYPKADILFVGANNRMEMEKVPTAGYPIVGLDVAGFYRSQFWKNFSVLWKLMKSLGKAKKILTDFQPDIAIGVGGYVSAPILRKASALNIPTLVQEQNSFAGVTNRLLAKKAKTICVAYEGMEKFFPAEKIVVTGNPCRKSLLNPDTTREEAAKYFNLDPRKQTVLVIGGSLGSRTINQSIVNNIEVITNKDIQVIWQCGKLYFFDLNIEMQYKANSSNNMRIVDFIDRMDYAYKLADLVISRSGAGAISELALLQKPVILIPSPNVAEDHQTKNAEALVERKAAVLVKDEELAEALIPTIIELIDSKEKLQSLSENITAFATPDATDKIVDEIEKVINQGR